MELAEQSGLAALELTFALATYLQAAVQVWHPICVVDWAPALHTAAVQAAAVQTEQLAAEL
jgi:hypothetical protein